MKIKAKKTNSASENAIIIIYDLDDFLKKTPSSQKTFRLLFLVFDRVET